MDARLKERNAEAPRLQQVVVDHEVDDAEVRRLDAGTAGAGLTGGVRDADRRADPALAEARLDDVAAEADTDADGAPVVDVDLDPRDPEAGRVRRADGGEGGVRRLGRGMDREVREAHLMARLDDDGGGDRRENGGRSLTAEVQAARLDDAERLAERIGAGV